MKKFLMVGFLGILFVAGCGVKIANTGSTGKNVICFGDSLTAGFGASQGNDYPTVLAKLLKRGVINAGNSGDTTREALARLNIDVLSKDPRLVIVEFGGNDFFQKIPQKETMANLDQIVSLIQAKGAMVAVVGVRIGLLTDEYASVFRQVARDRKTILVPNVLKDIFDDPAKKSDEIHPNDQGYAIIAQRVFEKIKPFLN